MSNGVRRYMVSHQQTVAAVADHFDSKQTDFNYDALSGIYEEGMKMVLQQIARTQLRFEYEHGGAGYKESDAQSQKVLSLFAQLKADLPAELEGRLVVLQTEIGFLELEGMDAGYVSGFLAGYRFLKELNPQANDRQTPPTEHEQFSSEAAE